MEDYYFRKSCLLFDVDKIRNANVDKIIHSPTCTDDYNLDCRLECDSFLLLNFNVESHPTHLNNRFWMFLVLMIILSIGQVPVSSLGDSICFSIIGTSSIDYGSQRLWGSLGWAISTALCGILIDKLSVENASRNYVPVFYIVTICSILDIASVSFIKDIKHEHSKTFFRDIGRLCLDTQIRVFLLWCTVAGVFNGLVMDFIFWYIEDVSDCAAVNSVKTLEGLFQFVEGFGGEIPFFFLNAYLMKTLGHINCMSLVLFSFGVKFFIYSLMKNLGWWVLPIGLLNGITFSTFYATMASQAATIAIPGTEATVLAIFSASYEGVGTSVGSFIADTLTFYFDDIKIFQFYGFTAVGTCILYMILQNVLLAKKPLQRTVT